MAVRDLATQLYTKASYRKRWCRRYLNWIGHERSR